MYDVQPADEPGWSWPPFAAATTDVPGVGPSVVARAMIESQRDAGSPPRVWPSAPWWAPFYLFEEALGIPFASGGAGHAGGAHAADEYATIEGLREHMRQSVAFLHRFAQATAEAQ
jgi:acetylornithine deacetylase/succinyl-diaminopimelate desuccinylase-like protein